MRTAAASRREGFTLMEVTVTLFVLGLVATLTLPALSLWRGRAEVRGTAEIGSWLDEALRRAAGEGGPWVLRVPPRGTAIRLVSRGNTSVDAIAPLRLPAGWRVATGVTRSGRLGPETGDWPLRLDGDEGREPLEVPLSAAGLADGLILVERDESGPDRWWEIDWPSGHLSRIEGAPR